MDPWRVACAAPLGPAALASFPARPDDPRAINSVERPVDRRAVTHVDRTHLHCRPGGQDLRAAATEHNDPLDAPVATETREQRWPESSRRPREERPSASHESVPLACLAAPREQS
jgi:hypothetical protein